MDTLIFWIWLEVKHVVCDLCLQSGKFGWVSTKKRVSIKGVATHALIHASGVALVLCGLIDLNVFHPSLLIFSLVLIDGVSHFIIDEAKIIAEREWGYHRVITIVDQLLHQFCYAFMILLMWL